MEAGGIPIIAHAERYFRTFTTVENIWKLKEAGCLVQINCYDLTAGMPTDEELESLVGRNCGELLDEGWIFSGCMYEEKELWMIHGIYEYTIIFDGEIENKEDFDENEELSHLTVSSITCTGVGDAGYLEEEEQAE